MAIAKTDHTDRWLLQNRRIWATAHALGLGEDALRDAVEATTGGRSLSALDERRQSDVISALDGLKTAEERKRRRQKKRIGPEVGDGVTHRQIVEIRRLAEILGWGRPALRAWLKRCFGSDREEWLSARKAGAAIQGLKAMVSRKEKAAARQ